MAYKRDPRNAFIKDAFADGYSVDEINAYLSKKGYEPVGKLENTIYNNKLSAGTGITGGVAGTAVLGKPGAMIGATGGKAFGNLIEDIYEISKGAYKAPKDYKEAFNMGMSNIGNAAQWGVGAEALVNLPSILKALVTPLQTTKNTAMKVRDLSVGNQSLPTDTSKTEILDKLKNSNYYKMATPEIQKMAESRLNQYFEGVNPLETINPSNTGFAGGQSVVQSSPNLSVNKMYEYLPSFEKTGRAYNTVGEAGSAAISQGTNLASHAVRDYLNTQIPKPAQISNDVYSAVSKIQPGFHRVVKTAIPGAIIYQLIKNLTNSIKGE